MRPFLLYEQSHERSRKKNLNENELIQDLNLNSIFKAMAQEDRFLYDTAKSVILNSVTDTGTILYRQSILKDCIQHMSIIRRIYHTTSIALKDAAYYKEYNQPNYARIVPASERVQKSVGLLELLVGKLEELKASYALIGSGFRSEGLNAFYSQQRALFTYEFFVKVKEHIADIRFLSKGGKIVIGSGLGNGMKGAGHVLRKISDASPGSGTKKGFGKIFESNTIHIDNVSIANSAREIEDGGLIHIVRVMNCFTDNIIRFLEELRYEIGFYVGCINLYTVLSGIDAPLCFPVPEDIEKKILIFKELHDASLAIEEGKRPVTNDLDASGRNLLIITGANQGGKSTFLRSIGLSQVLMQCGLFVPAAYFRANVCDSIFTHFTREEDAHMNSGKLDEELLRMNHIINHITSGSLLLMNEPFATTTERDGSRIARDIITALYDHDVKVLFVTHLFEFSNDMYNLKLEKAVFLRAERNDDGQRTFTIKMGEPLQTSYGEDLFESVIGKI